MTKESIFVSALIPAQPDRVYEAWLDSRGHSAMTGGTARIDPTVGGAHSAWDGYIEGVTLELEPGRRVVQSWRTQEFPADADHSTIDVRFEPFGEETRVSINHTNIPEGQGKSYESGWHDHYFKPMAVYFVTETEPGAAEGGGVEITRIIEVSEAFDDDIVEETPPTLPADALFDAARHAPAKKKAAKKPAKVAAPKKASAAKKPAAKKPAAKKPAKAAAKKAGGAGAKKATPKKVAKTKKTASAKKAPKKSTKKASAKKAAKKRTKKAAKKSKR